MSKKDTSMKALLSKNEVFADACNQYFFHGENVVSPECLKELDSTELALPFGKSDRESVANQKYRDLLKHYTVKSDSKSVYCIFGIEAQSKVHYAMPVRNLLYDAMHLSKQVADTSRKHKEQKKSKGSAIEEITSAEYLSGFYKTDKIIPVLTLVVYLGVKPWDGPTSLSEMYTETDERILQHVMDYKMHILDLTHCNEEEISRFCDELFQVTTFVKSSETGKELKEKVIQSERFSHVSREVIDVVQNFTRYHFEGNGGKEDDAMCKGLIELREEGKAEGKADLLEQLMAGGLNKEQLMKALDVTSEGFDKMLLREPVEA